MFTRSPLLLAVVVAACRASGDLEATAPCEHAGFAIASRVHACTGDADAANTVFEKFRDNTACQLTGGSARPQDFDCAITIAAVDCDTTRAYANDIALWLSLQGCPPLFEAVLADTGALP